MNIAAYIYIIVSLLEIVAEYMGNDTLRFATKPLLMPLLIWFYAQALSGAVNKMHRLMLIAFVFSWVGDVALMFVGVNPNFFLVGLVGFLITHLFYAVAFTHVVDKNAVPILKQKIWIAIPLAIYFAGLIAVVFPAVEAAMKIPVAVYSTVIATMVLFAINRYGRVSSSSFGLVMGGAFLFMFSDSLIAVNKFLYQGTLSYAGVLIMLLYIAGQYLIAKGMLRNNESFFCKTIM